jgi:hypothetical protein
LICLNLKIGQLLLPFYWCGDNMSVWILTVYLLTTNPVKVWKVESFKTEEECLQWVNFYNEYPFKPICEKSK